MATVPVKPRFLRWLTGVNISLLILAFGLVDSDLPGPAEGAPITAAAGEHRFNLAVWEFAHLNKLLSGGTTGNGESLRRYFELAESRRTQDQKLLRAVSESGSATTARAREAQRQWIRIADQMESLEPQALSAVRVIVSEALTREGLTTDFPGFGGRVFPPVSFVLEELPRMLVVSPRDRIELIETVALRPGITVEEMESIEAALARRNLSALVDLIGGIATYPSLVREDLSLRRAISTVAHEWAHHYLFFRPLGQRYGAGSEMTTINETFANIVGDEIASSHFGEEPPSFSTSLDSPEQARIEGRFDADRHLRETRQRTDELLTDGRIEEAEGYLEERRIELTANGVFIRKLNQAFFAFRGTYADSPVSVSSVFRQLTLLRRSKPSLESFVASVASIKSPDQLERLVVELTG